MQNNKPQWTKGLNDLRLLMLAHHFPAYLINRISAMYIKELRKENAYQ